MQDQHDPALLTAATAALEATINQALTLAPGARKELAEMADTVIAIDCSTPAVAIFITITEQGKLEVSGYSEAKNKTLVRGSLEDFLALAIADDPAAMLINSDLEIIGQTAPLLTLQQIITRMDLDWEAPLVNVLGDVAGHQLAQWLRGVFSWSKDASQSLRRQLSEFILEEGRLSPPAAELDVFFDDIQSLGLRVDRLASQLQRLARNVDGRD